MSNGKSERLFEIVQINRVFSNKMNSFSSGVCVSIVFCLADNDKQKWKLKKNINTERERERSDNTVNRFESQLGRVFGALFCFVLYAYVQLFFRFLWKLTIIQRWTKEAMRRWLSRPSRNDDFINERIHKLCLYSCVDFLLYCMKRIEWLPLTDSGMDKMIYRTNKNVIIIRKIIIKSIWNYSSVYQASRIGYFAQ